jgi:hypothetical protein
MILKLYLLDMQLMQLAQIKTRNLFSVFYRQTLYRITMINALSYLMSSTVLRHSELLDSEMTRFAKSATSYFLTLSCFKKCNYTSGNSSYKFI